MQSGRLRASTTGKQIIMKLFVVLTAAVALVGATQVPQPGPGYGIHNAQGRVIGNEIRRVFSNRGGWGSPSGGEPSGYRPGPPPPGLDGSLMNLFNAMSSFGLSPSYGAPGSGGPSSSYGPPSGGSGGSGSSKPPSSQYGPPAAGSRPPSSQYGPPASGGNGGSGPSSQYGPPASGSGSGGYSQGGAGALGGAVSTRSRGTGGAPSGRTTANPGAGGAQATAADGGRIFRYVSLFTAPDEPPPPARKIVRAGPSTPDKHVNIIFVKPPAPAQEQPTEVVLSAEPQRKTIVYVLMKKPVEGQETVRVRPAPPTQPSKPEVYFIPYTDPSGQKPGGDGNGNGDNGQGGQGGYGDGGASGGSGSGSGDQSGGYNNGPSGGGGYDNGPATGPSAPPSGGYNNGGIGPSAPPSGGYNNGGGGSSNGLVFMGLSAPGGYD